MFDCIRIFGELMVEVESIILCVVFVEWIFLLVLNFILVVWLFLMIILCISVFVIRFRFICLSVGLR